MELGVGVFFGDFNSASHNQWKLLSDPEGGMEFLKNSNPECAKDYGV
jgi:hypothetical protein